jgi:hypothetical protein
MVACIHAYYKRGRGFDLRTIQNFMKIILPIQPGMYSER